MHDTMVAQLGGLLEALATVWAPVRSGLSVYLDVVLQLHYCHSFVNATHRAA